MQKPHIAVAPLPSPALQRLHCAAGIIVSALAGADTTLTPSVGPPGALSVTPLEAVFSEQPPNLKASTATKKQNSGPTMLNLCPNLGFLVDQRKFYEGTGKIDEIAIAVAINKCRKNFLWHFHA